MRKKSLGLMLVLLFVALMGFAACGKADPEVTGLSTVHLKADAIAYDFAEGVTAKVGEETKELEIDSSEVVFGTKGVYKVYYSVDGKIAGERTVKIYTAPLFATGSSDAAQISFADALQNGATGLVTATDCFGDAIDVSVTDAGGFYDSANNVVYGAHTIIYSATDAAGNTASVTKVVTVNVPSDAPIFTGESTSYDLADSTLQIAVNLKSKEIIAVKLQGETIATANYSYADGKLTLFQAFVNDIETGNNSLRLETTGGYALHTLNITDTNPPVYEVDDIDGYVFPVGTEVSLPVAVKGENGQRITFTYYLNDVEIAANDLDTVVFDDTGDYTFKITASTSGGTEDENEFTITAISAEQYGLIVYSGASNQFEGRLTLPPYSVNEDFSITVHTGEVEGKTGMYKMTTGSGDLWGNRFILDPAYLSGISQQIKDIANYFLMDIYAENASNFFAVIGEAQRYYDARAIKVYESGTMTEIFYSDAATLMAERWLTVEIPMDSFDSFNFCFSAANTDFYVGNIRFSQTPASTILRWADREEHVSLNRFESNVDVTWTDELLDGEQGAFKAELINWGYVYFKNSSINSYATNGAPNYILQYNTCTVKILLTSAGHIVEVVGDDVPLHQSGTITVKAVKSGEMVSYDDLEDYLGEWLEITFSVDSHDWTKPMSVIGVGTAQTVYFKDIVLSNVSVEE